MLLKRNNIMYKIYKEEVGEFYMIKVLFVCLGNICRSPMAEFILKEMVKRRNLEDDFFISSAGTSSEEERK